MTAALAGPAADGLDQSLDGDVERLRPHEQPGQAEVGEVIAGFEADPDPAQELPVVHALRSEATTALDDAAAYAARYTSGRGNRCQVPNGARNGFH